MSGHELPKWSPNTCVCDTSIHDPMPISQIPPMTYAAFAGAAILVGGLVWWRGRR